MLPSSQSTTGWLLLEQGDLAGRRYCCETSMCPSPVCQCERVTLRCSPELAPQTSVPVCLEMDLAQCEIANFKKLKSDPASSTVAKAIANEISKADWNKLWGFYLGAKRHLTEHADPDQIDAHFPLTSWRATAAGITKFCPMPNRLSSRSGLKLGCLTTNTASARTARVKRQPFHSLNFAPLPNTAVLPASRPSAFGTRTILDKSNRCQGQRMDGGPGRISSMR